MTSNGIVQKLWNYCNVLRDDGLSYGDYVEPLTYLLFLKMADEQARPPFNRAAIIPKDLDWQTLLRLDFLLRRFVAGLLLCGTYRPPVSAAHCEAHTQTAQRRSTLAP